MLDMVVPEEAADALLKIYGEEPGTLMHHGWAEPYGDFLGWLDDHYDLELITLPHLPPRSWVKVFVSSLPIDGEVYVQVQFKRMSPKEIRSFRAMGKGMALFKETTLKKMRGPRWTAFYYLLGNNTFPVR